MRTLAISVALPIVVLLGWCLKLELNLQTGALVRLKAVGYDPRDLISGHFLRFSLDFQSIRPCDGVSTEAEACLCLSPSAQAGFHEISWGGVCEARSPDCNLFIRGQCHSSRFSAGLEQYFIPEFYAPVLTTVPADSSVILSIQPDGKAAVKKFLVGEVEIERYAEERLAQPTETPSP